MPESTDILLERLRQFDEVTLLELLNITTDDILKKFRGRVIELREQLFGEVEIFNIDDEELDNEDDLDGFQVEQLYEEDDY